MVLVMTLSIVWGAGVGGNGGNGGIVNQQSHTTQTGDHNSGTAVCLCLLAWNVMVASCCLSGKVMVASCCMVVNEQGLGRCISCCLLFAASTTQSANANGGNGGDGVTG